MTLREIVDMDDIRVRIERDESKCNFHKTDYESYFEGLSQVIPQKLLDMEVLSCERCVATSCAYKPDIVIGV